MSMERAAELPSGQLVCLGCGQVLDKVVANFAELEWDDVTEDYSVLAGVGDFACPYCGEPVHRERFYLQEEPPGRLFPQTYSDWVSLAEDIKARDPGAAFMVNAALDDIANETEYADVQKRWLTEKAGGLGIS